MSKKFGTLTLVRLGVEGGGWTRPFSVSSLKIKLTLLTIFVKLLPDFEVDDDM